ncbi:MAG: glycoside hydrolase family 3 N-terminal domain-containing protein [Microthrixaceae bacterium]
MPWARPGPRTRIHRPTSWAAAIAIAVLAGGCAGTSSEQVATEITTTTSTSSTTTTTRPPDCASTLPTVGQVAQLLMVMVPDPANARDSLEAGLASGFGLKGNQRSDVADEISAATEGLVLPPTVAVDEEGGTVQRLRYSAGRLQSAAEMAEGTPAQAAEEFSQHAARMADMGVTMNFAPVADVGDGADLGTRTYGDDPATVAEFVAAVVEANLAAGIVPVVKHWPGIGSAPEDPHDSLPVIDPIDELRTADMVPFRAAFDAGVPAVMVAHAEVPGLTAEGEPASLSRAAITDELRTSEGFGGVVITDSLGMGAIVNSYSQAEAAELAIAAGADIALLSGPDVIADAHGQLVDAVESGRIPAGQVEDSVRRVLAMRGIEGECFDAVSAYAAVAREEAEQAAEEAEAEAEAEAEENATTSSTLRDTGVNDP